MKHRSLRRLEDACHERVKACLADLDRLGLEMTMGAELEFYAIYPEHTAHDRAWYAERLMKLAEKDPDAFQRHHMLNFARCFPHDLGSTPEDRRKTIENLISCWDTEVLRTTWLSHRIQAGFEEAGIPVHNYGNEVGVARGTDYFAKQLEISTGIGSPIQIADWIEKGRHIITKEATQQGVLINFDSFPSIDMARQTGESVEDVDTSGGHIHFGLQYYTTDQNALIATDGSFNRLASEIDKAGLELLDGGGILVCNPYQNDYLRLTKGSNVPTCLLVGETGDRDCAFCNVDTSKSAAHKELRVPGGNTPGSMTVFIPVLATWLGAMRTIGREENGKGGIHATGSLMTPNEKKSLEKAVFEPASSHINDRQEDVICSHAEAINRIKKVNTFRRHAPDIAILAASLREPSFSSRL